MHIYMQHTAFQIRIHCILHMYLLLIWYWLRVVIYSVTTSVINQKMLTRFDKISTRALP